jgi:exopolysaccharide biosynthesis polyprenyl glycosylphosphotransferase
VSTLPGAAEPVETSALDAGVGEAARSGNGHRPLSGLATALDERTLDILERRRASAGLKRRGRLVRRALMWADVGALSLAFALSEVLYRPAPSPFNQLGMVMEFITFFATLPLWLVAAKLYGLYDRDESRANHSTTDDIVGVFHLVTIVAWLLLAGAYLTSVASPAVIKVATFWLFAIPLVTLARVSARALCRGRLAYIQNTVVVGAGEVGQLVARKILQHPEYGINVVGFLDDRPKEPISGLEHLTLLGAPEQLATVVRDLDVDRVVVAFSNDPFERTLDLVRSLQDHEVQVDVVPRLFDLVSPSAQIHTLEGIPLLGIPMLHLSRSSKLVKRMMDVVLAGAGLILLAPLFGLIAWAIKLDSQGPVFFRQRRMGGDGGPFRILKFRTMVADAEERKAALGYLNKHATPGSDPRMFKIPNDPRITKVGAVLRRYSLDELPQLINVLRGEMSLVGPRPLIPEEHQHVDNWARKRMKLKPGITGLWQVLGRSDIPFEEMVKLDFLYVTSWSLWQDFRLLLRTIPIVLKGTGGAY